MEIAVSIITITGAIITALISASAYLRGRKEEAKAKLNETKKALAQQVVAYYCEEQILLEELAKTTGKNAETLKKEIRKRAATHEKNVAGISPDMSPAQAKRYL